MKRWRRKAFERGAGVEGGGEGEPLPTFPTPTGEPIDRLMN